MALRAMVADSADEIIGLARNIANDSAAAGTDVIFAIQAPRAVLHIMAGGISGEDLIDAFMVSRPVIRMDVLFPDISGSVHILRG